MPSLISSLISCGTSPLISSMNEEFAKLPSDALSEALLLSLSAIGLQEMDFLR